MNYKTTFPLDLLLACNTLMNIPLQGVLWSASLAVWWHTPHPDTDSSQGEEKKKKKSENSFGITGQGYAAERKSYSAAKELCLIPLFSLLCSNPCCLQGWFQTENTFGSLPQSLNSTSYLNPKHTALLWIHSMAEDFCSHCYLQQRNHNQNLLPTFLAQTWIFSPFIFFFFFILFASLGSEWQVSRDGN